MLHDAKLSYIDDLTQKILLWIAAFVADAPAVNTNGIKTLLASGLSTFFIKSNPVFSNGPKGLLKNLPDFPVLCNWVFDNFLLAEELLAKSLQSFETCVLVNNNLCWKFFLSSESPTSFDEIHFNTTFFPDFSLLSCKLDKFTFKVLY